MTREAKIGMLTGLGVIVLIGVLLSNYLGDPHALMTGAAPAAPGSPAVESNATGQMAPLPVGAGYRRQMLSPAAGAVEAPDMAQGTPADSQMHWAMATGPSLPAAVATGTEVFSGHGSGQAAGQTGPVIQNPVSPIATGISPVQTNNSGRDSGPPVIMVADATRVGPGSGIAPVAGAIAPARANASYTIAKGDTLNKIAEKFYRSAQNANVQRIIVANPGMLKDVNSVLIQGKTLVIPGAGPATPPVAAPSIANNLTNSEVPLPGDLGPGMVRGNGSVTTPPAGNLQNAGPKPAAGVYVVQAGDTLGKIAKKLSPAKSATMEQKLISLNSIKNPDDLTAGTKLKLPG